ncbi:P-loop containing nucleoside triphosphate hydrolase protein [Mycena sp. CBHHK59/15]|nr:P-loop containing nucleoside triphosphate hydrolase protein [Mycena sp. CBHHK59/15]
MQPTDDTNMVRPATTPTSGSSPATTVSTPREPDAALLAKLRLMLGETAQFKSFQQHDAVHLALERRTSFLALLIPGEGKSVLYQLPAFLETGKIIVICPRSALLLDQMKRATDLGIACFHWTASNDQVPPHTRLIFVALESLETMGFGNLFRDPELTRVALDEVHEFSTTAHRRPVWKTVLQLTNRAMQFLLLSGSVPFGHESRLVADLKFEVNLPVVRSPLWLPVHQFVHLRLGPGRRVPEFMTSLQAKLAQDFMQPGDQGIIFYPSPAAVQKWGGAQSCASWSGWEKRQMHETEWLGGKHQFMHATTTCSLGIDNERVTRSVEHGYGSTRRVSGSGRPGYGYGFQF